MSKLPFLKTNNHVEKPQSFYGYEAISSSRESINNFLNSRINNRKGIYSIYAGMVAGKVREEIEIPLESRKIVFTESYLHPLSSDTRLNPVDGGNYYVKEDVENKTMRIEGKNDTYIEIQFTD